MARPVAERTRRRAGWLSRLYAERTDQTALVPSTLGELEALRTQANAIASDIAIATNTRRRPWWAISLVSLLLLTGFVYASIGPGVPLTPGPEQTTCTFSDGTTVTGRCIFDEPFVTFRSNVWYKENEWPGPINGLTPELVCFREENASVSAGMLQLTMTNSARASCSQTWPITTHYNTVGCGGSCSINWPAGQPTSFDGAVIGWTSLRVMYGRIAFRIKSSGGVGPGPGLALFGDNCTGPGGKYMGGVFSHAPGYDCRFPARPGSTEIDLWAFKPTDPAWMNFSVYVDNSVGSPPLVNSFFGTSYYGGVWGNYPGFTPFIAGAGAPADPTSNFHIIECDWRPGSVEFFIDGTRYVNQLAAWIPSEPMGLSIALSGIVTVTGATLPQTAYVDWIKMWCPPAVPCEWSGAGGL